jgi:hypothetical protein
VLTSLCTFRMDTDSTGRFDLEMIPKIVGQRPHKNFIQVLCTDKTRQDKIRQDKTRQRQDKTKKRQEKDKTKTRQRQDRTKTKTKTKDKTRQDKTRQDKDKKKTRQREDKVRLWKEGLKMRDGKGLPCATCGHKDDE